MQPANMTFTPSIWMAVFCGVLGVACLFYALSNGARPRYFVPVIAMALAGAQTITEYVAFDDGGVSARAMFIEQKLAWDEIAAAAVVHRESKYGPRDSLELRDASGERTISLPLKDVDAARGAALSDLLARKLRAPMGEQARAVAQVTERK